MKKNSKKLFRSLFSVLCIMLLTFANVMVINAEGEETVPPTETEPAPAGGETPVEPTITVEVQKVWTNDTAEDRPAEVEITLKEGDNTVGTAKATAENDWTASFEVKDDNKEHEFTAVETPVEGYTEVVEDHVNPEIEAYEKEPEIQHQNASVGDDFGKEPDCSTLEKEVTIAKNGIRIYGGRCSKNGKNTVVR